ncbi:TraB/GumN family protein [Pseudoduganella namucuonensis]|nr:TraB/GumN family protein [Pseudoduganella namucuonensis]
MSINPHLSEGAAALAEQAAPRRGALYRVQNAGKTSYLFGTVHVGKQAFFPLEPQVTRALADSTTLVLELDVRANDQFQRALARYARYAPGDSVRRHLSPETLQLLEQAMARAGMSLAGMEQYKPWLLANILVGAEIERHGYARSNGVEQYLLSTAMRQRKPLRELESADYQLSLFDTLDDAQQEAYLRENLAELASGVSLKKTAGLIDAWSTADAPGIKAAWKTLVSGDTVSAAFMERTLLGKRNPEMAASIEDIMKTDQVAFVGVGLLHLVGDNSLPELLRERGYQVEQLY